MIILNFSTLALNNGREYVLRIAVEKMDELRGAVSVDEALGEQEETAMSTPDQRFIFAIHKPITMTSPEGSEHRKGKSVMTEFTQYRRKQIAELRLYQPGETLNGVSISAPDIEAGSPKVGDMIARNPKNHADQWLVAAQYFADNFEPSQ